VQDEQNGGVFFADSLLQTFSDVREKFGVQK
jgi:hypothetical protein